MGEQKTIIKIKEGQDAQNHGGFNVNAKYVTICNLKIVARISSNFIGLFLGGSNNSLDHIAFENCSLEVTGNFGHLDNLSFSKTSGNGRMPWGILIQGNSTGNTINSPELSSCTTGIIISFGASETILEDVKCRDVIRGVVIDGDVNSVKGMRYNCIEKAQDSGDCASAIVVQGGCGNKISDLECIKSNDKQFLSLAILLSRNESNVVKSSKNNSFENCGPGAVLLSGEGNCLKNVHGAPFMSVDGSDHRLENCVAEDFQDNGKGVQVIGCNFNKNVKENEQQPPM